MPEKEKNLPTEQVNVRVPVYMLEWLGAYKDAQPFRLKTTQVFEAALGEWLEKHAAQFKPKKAPR